MHKPRNELQKYKHILEGYNEKKSIKRIIIIGTDIYIS